MIVTSGELFKKARDGGYAVGSFNVSTLEAIKAIIEAAKELKSPVMIETSPGELNYMGAENVADIVRNLAEDLEIPVAIHLDHGQSVEQVKLAIDSGYTSVHIDASSYDFEKNVQMTTEAVSYAHKNGITIEGELGHIPGASESHEGETVQIDSDTLTDPKMAKEFVKETGIDILASSIGNIHGVYENEPQLDFDRLEEISKIGVPLSLHGGSGIPEDQIKKAISLGVTKINVNTELRIAFTESLRRELAENPDEVVPYKYLPEEIEAVKAVVKEKIKMFGSANKA
jgi:ketose-bisphosphate aldolase